MQRIAGGRITGINSDLIPARIERTPRHTDELTSKTKAATSSGNSLKKIFFSDLNYPTSGAVIRVSFRNKNIP